MLDAYAIDDSSAVILAPISLPVTLLLLPKMKIKVSSVGLVSFDVAVDTLVADQPVSEPLAESRDLLGTPILANPLLDPLDEQRVALVVFRRRAPALVAGSLRGRRPVPSGLPFRRISRLIVLGERPMRLAIRAWLYSSSSSALIWYLSPWVSCL